MSLKYLNKNTSTNVYNDIFEDANVMRFNIRAIFLARSVGSTSSSLSISRLYRKI